MRTEDINFEVEKGQLRSSYSALNLHRKCAQAWYYSYGLELERIPGEISPERDLGIWWSVVMSAESIQRGRKIGSIKFIPESLSAPDGIEISTSGISVMIVLEAVKKWWDRKDQDTLDAWKDRLGAENAYRHILGMYKRWWQASSETLANEEPIGVEVKFERTLPRPEGDSNWLLSNFDKVPELNLVGYIDEIYRDNSRGGMLVVRDHKTTKTIDVRTEDDVFDSQLPLYVWGVLPLLKEEGLPAPKAIAYDRTRSKAPSSPEVTASGALSRSKTDYDLTTYVSWISESESLENALREAADSGNFTEEQIELFREDLEPGVFWGKLGEYFKTGKRAGEAKFGTYITEDEEIERLSSREVLDKWSQKTLDPVNLNIVKSHLRSAVDSAFDIWQTKKRAESAGEAARSFNKLNCSWCDFKSLCRAQIVGGPNGEYDLEANKLQKKERRK